MNDDLTPEELKKMKFHPETEGVISLVRRKDGNWRGFITKNGKLLQTRAGTPQEALHGLIIAD